MWTSSELCITIICVCIPSLRPLWQRFRGGSSTDQYYNQSISHGSGFEKKHSTNPDVSSRNTEAGVSAYPLENIHNVKINAGREVILPSNWQEPDDKSDKIILGKSDGIVKKQEISVEYSAR